MRLIAIDVDDCLADYVGGFLKFLATKGTILKPQDIIRSFHEMGLGDYLDEFAKQGTLDDLGVVPYSKGCVYRLSHNLDLVALSSRNPDYATTTFSWLLRHFPEIKDVVVGERNKGDWCRRNSACGLIDDQIQYASQFENSYVIAQPWNKEWKGKRGTWIEITNMLLEECGT